MFLPLITSFLQSFLVASDTNLILNLGLVLAACTTIFHCLQAFVYSVARKYYISSVEIEGGDPTYRYLMRWMTVHQITITSKKVKATATLQTMEENPYEESELFKEQDKIDSDVNGDKRMPVNYRGIDKLPLRFEPLGQYIFWHKNTRFIFEHSVSDSNKETDFANYNKSIKLDCWGTTLKPIRDLLRDAQTEFLNSSDEIMIFRSAATGRSGDGYDWRHMMNRPARQLDTIIIDETKKQMLIDDVNEYLLSATRKWYASRGIPYRRGYLFSGMPGTGKTSLAFALTGVFGLPLYSVSLADPDLMESDLVALFSELPPRCIVLLEDIDAAGLKRGGFEPSVETLSRNHITTRSPSERSVLKSRCGLSLSALLNTIDGVGAQEGRVLIMTTNFIGALDPALIRHGRIDMRIHFHLATREQIRQLFLVMYRDHNAFSFTGSRDALADTVDNKTSSLSTLADNFAAVLPSDRLSLAAVQGHLLNYKKNPQQAVLNAESWGETMLEEAANARRNLDANM